MSDNEQTITATQEKTAYIVPGIGYTTDRSLLYFSGKLAEKAGYTRKPIHFGGFEKGVKGDEEKMKRAFRHAYNQLIDQLPENQSGKQTDKSRADHVSDNTIASNQAEESQNLFISKSIGTAVSLRADRRLGLHSKHILFTPLQETMYELKLLLEAQGSNRANDIIIFHGLNDPWAPDNELISSEAEECSVTLCQITEANHSLETGNVLTDIGNLRSVLEEVAEFLNTDTAENYIADCKKT
ncbi:MAG: hypothetical protein MSH24_05580 [Lachnospiraceae bacterium]|nr:hypothetical protein [Lachnospiraceae bacterium]